MPTNGRDSILLAVGSYFVSVVAVSVGTALGFVISVALTLALALLLNLVPSLPDFFRDVLFFVVGPALGALWIGLSSAFLSSILLGIRPRRRTPPAFRARATAHWTFYICFLGVLVVYYLTLALQMDEGGAFKLIANAWTWPMWMIPVGIAARRAGMADDRWDLNDLRAY